MARLELNALSAEYIRLNGISTRLGQENLEVTRLLQAAMNCLTKAYSNAGRNLRELEKASKALTSASAMLPKDPEN